MTQTSEKLAVFDLDGTLSDSGPGIMHCAQYAFHKMGFPEKPETVLRSFVGPPLNTQFCATGPMTPAQAEQAVAYYRELYNDTGKFENTVYPGIPSLLAELRKKGFRLAVATAKPAFFTEQILDHFDLTRAFDTISAATMDETKTDKASLILTAMRETGFENSPNDVVMVGDRAYDILGARKNGVHSVGVLYGYGSRSELEEAGAEYIAESTADLGNILMSFGA